ncbi:MAG TPA: hypothetical protein ENK06_07835 [Gammaproteobacteria bacterium]|nr:hypothetical protein [Gammaproteobacteria bacterium]
MKQKMRISVVLVLILLAASLHAKPRSSLYMSMNWTNGVAFDQPVSFHVAVTSLISSKKMRFKLNLPKGVSLISGNASFEREIEKGVPLSLDFTVVIEKNASGAIAAEASIGDSSQVFFRAARTLVIANTTNSKQLKARDTAAPGFHYSERNGVKLREYRLP